MRAAPGFVVAERPCRGHEFAHQGLAPGCRQAPGREGRNVKVLHRTGNHQPARVGGMALVNPQRGKVLRFADVNYLIAADVRDQKRVNPGHALRCPLCEPDRP